ncbi:MAG: GNAT family N-acetyltransferase [Bdellovibrio sp.]|nr:GNAT family N-acetyltransferase [Bdellovibrio sp.]
MNTRIRKATIDDCHSLATLFEEGDKFHREALPDKFRKPEGPSRGMDYFQSVFSDPNMAIFILNAEGADLGCAVVQIIKPPSIPIIVPRKYGLIDNIVVKESHRGKGLAKLLMEACHQWLRDEGIFIVELNVHEFNSTARNFYEKLGYETISRKMSRSL